MHPADTLEMVLTEKAATYLWRHGRVLAAEAKKENSGGLLEDVTGPTRDQLLRAEISLDRGFYRALSELERLQRMRLGQAVPPPIKMDVSLEPSGIQPE